MTCKKTCQTMKLSAFIGQRATLMRKFPAAALGSTTVLATILLGACTTIDESAQNKPLASAESPLSEATAVSTIDRTIVTDILQVAQQIYTPFSTTLQFSRDNDPLLEHFVREFSSAGYGVQRVSADQGSNFFRYTRSEDTSATGEPLVRFNTYIGIVEISRDYTVPRENMVSPASAVRLSGTRVPVTVNDAPNGRFAVSDPNNSTAIYVASMNLDEQAPPVISLITEDLVERVVTSNTQAANFQALNASRVEINNLFYADQSNFTATLDGFEQSDRQIVVFGNDSMILGNTNKLLIEQLVNNRLGPDDLISLVGCSNGPTVLDIGNEGLALGRAERVTQALLSHGIARERILDEGCWAPVSAGEKFPSRGVVLELWRKKA